jgi:hypothetical protein
MSLRHEGHWGASPIAVGSNFPKSVNAPDESPLGFRSTKNFTVAAFEILWGSTWTSPLGRI